MATKFSPNLNFSLERKTIVSFSFKISTALLTASSRSSPILITEGLVPAKRINPTAFSLFALGDNAWAALKASILLLNLLTLSLDITDAAFID